MAKVAVHPDFKDDWEVDCYLRINDQGRLEKMGNDSVQIATLAENIRIVIAKEYVTVLFGSEFAAVSKKSLPAGKSTEVKTPDGKTKVCKIIRKR